MAGLYIHVPFCSKRCVYCDFYVTTTSRDTAAFAASVRREAERLAAEFGRVPLRTLYLGGGTPSLLPPEDLAAVIGAAHAAFDLSGLEELTVEANPEHLSADWLRAARSFGATRLSLGVQSFFDDDLAFMTRAHDAATAEAGVRATAEVFDDFSVDLIFGLPGQPFEHWGANLEKALRLGAPHVSAYSLTVEERTPLHKLVAAGTVVPAGDETLRERFLFTHDYLEARGLEHYEVSSFARPGHRSRHNTGYWTHANTLAIGPSAHAFWRETRSRAWRWADVAPLARWQALVAGGQAPTAWRERLDADALADEAVLLGLRQLADGLDLDRLEADYGVDLLTERRAELAALEGAGLLRVGSDRVHLTAEGAAVADAVALRLVG